MNIQTTDKWDWTALHMAAYGGYDEMTKVLIEEGADLNARTVDVRQIWCVSWVKN